MIHRRDVLRAGAAAPLGLLGLVRDKAEASPLLAAPLLRARSQRGSKRPGWIGSSRAPRGTDAFTGSAHRHVPC